MSAQCDLLKSAIKSLEDAAVSLEAQRKKEKCLRELAMSRGDWAGALNHHHEVAWLSGKLEGTLRCIVVLYETLRKDMARS